MNHLTYPPIKPRSAGSGGMKSVPYHAGPGVKHELAIAFSFISLMAFAMILFNVWWAWDQRRDERLEQERCAKLTRKGFPCVWEDEEVDIREREVREKKEMEKQAKEERKAQKQGFLFLSGMGRAVGVPANA